jgi:2-polyprenyl-3-methyl-5-hydroxy-6-metoxy-1,4-benzoquinol methylase
MTGRPSLLVRGGEFLRSRAILLRRRIHQTAADWRGSASNERARRRWSPSDFTATLPEMVWTRRQVVRAYLHELASGDPRCDWVTWMLYRYATGKGLSALVLGCGDGWLERALAGNERIAKVVGVDFSEETLAQAANLAALDPFGGKIRHAPIDLDRDAPPFGPYDLILAHDVIHHVRDLEGFFDRIAAALTPEGVLLFCEYVGPPRFAYDARRRGIIDEFLRALPEKYRVLSRTGGFATQGVRTDPGEVARADPSEAVRSDEILPILRSKMRVLEEIPYGGSLLNPLLYELVANFEDGNEADDAILHMLCAAEKVLIRTGVLPPDFVVAAAMRR